MFKYKIGEDSPIPKFMYLKIRRRDGVESLTTLEEGELKVPIDGCIKGNSTQNRNEHVLCVISKLSILILKIYDYLKENCFKKSKNLRRLKFQ